MTKYSTKRSGYPLTLDIREISAILASLRMYQSFSQKPFALQSIADNGGTIKPLSSAEIDTLAVKLNLAPVRRKRLSRR